MASSSTSDMEMDTMMTPWLHFAAGDNLFFKSVRPSSHGAVAGACLVLIIVAILERWVSAIRGVLEVHWVRSARTIIAGRFAKFQSTALSNTSVSMSTKELDVASEVDGAQGNLSDKELPHGGRVSRSSPPFIASHDVPRGLAFAFQALLAYILMLAVMTFQAAYIISIVVGLGIGEIMFGRLGSARGHVAH
ncbi:hypothetical protein EW026_g394 [Hermanssonia centrifuga]|uniref:Copper transport protein n=1 Tax=Hermanssonia centrifuga TaxID=98765 RepID=A0A4S4KWL1_9APHY|nr:hypothetical protein EW026_g394 [Hermanssonia centrifuga]